jgi:hypothetical protein
MKTRTEGFLSREFMDHDSEQFDYIKELHQYLWRFVRCELPGATGLLGDYLDDAVEKAEKRMQQERVMAEMVTLTEPFTDTVWDTEDELMREHEFFAIRIIRDGKAKPLKYYQVHCFGTTEAYTFSSCDIGEMSDRAQDAFRKSIPDEIQEED